MSQFWPILFYLVGSEEVRIKKVTRGAAVEQLRAEITAYERVYEMRSGDMLDAISSGERSDTAEIVVWMNRYHLLQRLTAET